MNDVLLTPVSRHIMSALPLIAHDTVLSGHVLGCNEGTTRLDTDKVIGEW